MLLLHLLLGYQLLLLLQELLRLLHRALWGHMLVRCHLCTRCWNISSEALLLHKLLPLRHLVTLPGVFEHQQVPLIMASQLLRSALILHRIEMKRLCNLGPVVLLCNLLVAAKL